MFTIGADPEFFIQSEMGDMVPIVGLLGGTKEKPIPVRGAPKGFAVQEDNVMAEYNIPATTDYVHFADIVQQGRQYALAYIQQRRPDAMPYLGCSALFSSEQLDNPQAQTFGCSPDFDAYAQGAPLPRIQPQALSTPDGAWRFAGGHVHLGYKAFLSYEVPDFVVATLCDLIVSIPLLSYGFDPQGERRQFSRYTGTLPPDELRYRVPHSRQSVDHEQEAEPVCWPCVYARYGTAEPGRGRGATGVQRHAVARRSCCYHQRGYDYCNADAAVHPWLWIGGGLT